MELERQRIKIGTQHVSMIDMVSDLTGLVRKYRDFGRPLAKRRAELHEAWNLGKKIDEIASQRPWRGLALQNVLRALEIQDGSMYERVTEVLARAREKRESENLDEQDDVMAVIEIPQSPIELSMSNLINAEDKIGGYFGTRDSEDTVDSEQVLLFFEQTQREGHNILDLVQSSHPEYRSNDVILHGRLRQLRNEDPEMYQRVARTLNGVQAARIESRDKHIPNPRTPAREVEVYVR